MSTSLANPRRTRLSTLPGQGTENPEPERQATPADSETSASNDQGGGA